MVDKLIEKVSRKTFAAIAAALSAGIVALLAAVKLYFAKKKAYNKGRVDEREDWKVQEKKWKQKVEEIKNRDISIREKLRGLDRLKKEFEEYKQKESEKE